MASRSPLVRLILTALLTALVGLPALATSAAARVSIVPDQATGGGTRTFAFRLANERSGTSSTRLEITFPQNLPIAFVQVAPAPGWAATVRPRPLNPPAKMGDKVVSEVAASIILEGGAVQPHQFEQFLITMGPLPADGRMVFQTTQSFADGAVEHLTEAQVPGAATPGAPVISLGAATAEAAAPAGSALPPQEEDAPAAIAAGGGTDDGGGLPPLTVLWVAIGVALLIIFAVWLQARRSVRRSSTSDTLDPDGPDTEPEATVDAVPADSTEVVGK